MKSFLKDPAVTDVIIAATPVTSFLAMITPVSEAAVFQNRPL